jgi:hypothetical protein
MKRRALVESPELRRAAMLAVVAFLYEWNGSAAEDDIWEGKSDLTEHEKREVNRLATQIVDNTANSLLDGYAIFDEMKDERP